MTHHNFFRANRYPYITHSSPNSEHDGLHIARASQLLNPETLKTGLTEKGNPSFALESLASDSKANEGLPFSVNPVFKVSGFKSWEALAMCKPSCSLLGEE